MAELHFNNEGVPLMGFGTRYFAVTTGSPKKPKNIAAPSNDDPDYTYVEDIKLADWGVGNSFPDKALNTIEKISVLNTGLKFLRNLTIGQGIFPVKVVGFDDRGNETLQVVDDSKLRLFINSRTVRRYIEKSLRDYLKFGPAFVQLIPSADGSQMVGINSINARYCRLSVANSSGMIEKCIVSGKWPDTPSSKGVDYMLFDVLDEYDPYMHLTNLKTAGKIKALNLIYVVRDSWSNNEYYSLPIWYSAYQAGWMDVAQSVPLFLKKAFENQITWKFHVKIPYAFWDRKFPLSSFKSIQLREEAIKDYMDKVEENLCGPQNAEKPIFTFYEINPSNGKAEEQWIIEPISNKLGNDQNLITSAAANSEILFSLMINPNVMGAGMPGGSYAGNTGGSNIREAFLVNLANAWIDRQSILDPLEAFLRFNGMGEDIELRFRNTILTTLDTGAGTTKTLS
jgi:hypothetical protein